MKKTMLILLAVVLMVSGCSKQETEGITLSREAYDQLNEARIERDRLANEVATLKARLEALEGQSPVGDGDLDSDTGNDDSQSSDAGQSTQETPGDKSTADSQTGTGTDSGNSTSENSEKPTESNSEDETAAMNLVRYKDSYGYYGYKNVSGEVVIEAQFDTATEFANGYATVTNGGKTGTVSDRGILNWNTMDTYKKATVQPRNDVKEGSGFAVFLQRYRKALDERDEAYVKSHTHPNVKISFGGHSGWDGLVDYWKLDQGSDDFYKMMKTTLEYGAVDTSGGLGNAYTAPYMFTDFPSAYDAFSYSVVTGANVNLRARPTTDAEVVGQATYDVLKVLEPEKDGWVKVQLPDGTSAYIYGKYIWSPIYYRAAFTKVDDTWLLEFFVKGD